MIYIAAPFWDANQKTRNYRRRKAIEYSERLFHKGIRFYSPLLYSAHFQEKKASEGYWLQHGLKMVDVCDEMRVLCLEGWEKSAGIKGEIARAEDRGIPVEYITRHVRLSFHGSRSLSMAQCKPVIIKAFETHLPDVVVTHGEPEGACQYTRQLARKNGLSLKLHHLQHWRMQGQFHWRSKAVLEDSEFAIFLHDGQSNGTAGELDMAKKMGVPFQYFSLKNKKLVETKNEQDDIQDFQLDILDDEFEKMPQSARKSPEYQRFRVAVLKRDKNKCVFCGATDQLCVHHIVPFSKNKALAMDPSNGQTLCENCHRSVHGKPKR